MARAATGSLLWKGNGWYARFMATVDGERVRVTRKLNTDNKAVAKAKLRRLVAGEAKPEEAGAGETFAEAARRVVEASGIKTASDRIGRLERFAFATLGPMQVGAIRAAHVRECLETYAATGASQQSVRLLRGDLGAVLGALWRDEVIVENPVSRVRTPKAHRDNRERAVLTDAELVMYLAWEHPEEKHQKAVRERQAMACVARMFGGLRTGDLHTLRWESFDVAGGFTWGFAPRAKTARPQRLPVPEMLRPIVTDWWQRQGRPTSGLVFPALRDGKHSKAGTGEKHDTSHAGAFRDDLKRAFGLLRLVEHRRTVADRRCASGKREVAYRSWEPAREMTPREVELFTETASTKPVDFHSWRRAFVQALADAEVNAQQAQALAGHSTMAAHERYLRSSVRNLEIPIAALPRLTVLDPADPIASPPSNGFSVFSAPAAGLEPATRRLTGQRSNVKGEKTPDYSHAAGGRKEPFPPVSTAWIRMADPIAVCADAALAAWLRVRAGQLAAERLH